MDIIGRRDDDPVDHHPLDDKRPGDRGLGVLEVGRVGIKAKAIGDGRGFWDGKVDWDIDVKRFGFGIR